MGVKSLWSIVAPISKAIRLETLAHKILAIDASIWLYQFLKAMRDSDGNVMEGAHVIGFLRRICKLLFWGVRPVFVFDGSAPALKLATVVCGTSLFRLPWYIRRDMNLLLEIQIWNLF
jgi:DNA excision repair protein ERCC-5